MTPKGKNIDITIIDDKGRSSLFLHAGGIWDRAKNVSRSEGGNSPLTTIKQRYKSQLPIDSEKTKDMAAESVGFFGKMMKYALIILSIMPLESCHNLNKNVSGKYCAMHGKGIDCIKLNSDGSFVQNFKNDTISLSNSGTWKFETEMNHEKLILRNYVTYVLPDDIDSESIGMKGSASIYWEEGKIVFYIGAEEKYNYYRQSD